MSLSDPFFIEGPATISLSGGRTSAYMLRRILDAHGDTLPGDVHVIFANTGKEREETLDFVRDCETRWNVRIRWVELRIVAGVVKPAGFCVRDGQIAAAFTSRLFHTFREVDHATASRNGEPFAAMIRARSFLPNPVMRICTQELKVRPMDALARSLGLDEWTSVIGMRADEPRRVAKVTADPDKVCPLAAAGITEDDVLAFWAAQPFDLRLKRGDGNCDNCFMRSRAKLEQNIRERPHSADWWIEQESQSFGTKPDDARFRHDRPSYAQMLDHVRRTPMLPMFDQEDAMPCACTD